VEIARADERIAMAKAGVAVSRNLREREIEETYFKLLIAQRRLVSAEWKLRNNQNRPLYASTSIRLVDTSVPESELAETTKAMLTASTEVKELTASLNRVMGWPEDTQLELVIPEPLVEHVSLQEVAGKPAAVAPELIEAQENVVKARAASTLSKLAYVPTVAAVSGFMFQNVIPAVPSTYGYGGVVVSYNLFDFGKRERAVKEARAQLEMAELGVQLTKAKIAGNLTKSYFELERSRQLSQIAQKMGSSVLMNVRAVSESAEIRAARADLEVEMLEADLAHRQAFARLTALMGQ
jgi:outer membrane protein TolC